MKKNDLLLILTILFAALLIFLGLRLFSRAGEAVEITVNGEVTGVYPLSEDRTIPVSDCAEVRIEGGKAFMAFSDCPNQICVRHAPIARAGQTVVCLPNGITVRILGDSGFDAVVG